MVDQGDKEKSRGSEGDREWQKKKGEIERGREEMRELSVKAYGIDLLLLPINYPQKLFEPDTRKTGMRGEIGRGE